MKTETMLPAMQLIGWCKNIDRQCAAKFPDIFRPALMRALVKGGFLRPYTEAYGWRLTADGYRWLAVHGYPIQPDQHTQRAKRRFDNAAVAVTMYAAGISPFQDSISAFCEQGGYLPAFILRAQDGSHLLGSNQVVGFVRMGDVLLAVHYPHPDRKVVLQREHDCAESMTLRSGCMDMGYLFCGESYGSIYRSLVGAYEENGTRRKQGYVGLFRQSRFAYLLPCDGLGAVQLHLMCIPGFKAKLAPMLGGNAGNMAGQDMPDCDFIDPHYHLPARIMLDMELCRVPYAAWQAQKAGYNGLVLAAFETQKRFLEQLYPPPFYEFAVIPDDIITMLKEGDAHAPPV